MIIGLIHKGSGIGDQLFSYIATRVRAADLGVDFGFVGKEFFKGVSFMDLDWGTDTSGFKYIVETSTGALIPQTKRRIFVINRPYYDPEFNFIQDGTVIDGYGAQDIRYFEHRLDEIRDWLKVEPLDVIDNTWIVNIRGGEYRTVPELILPKEYWHEATNGKFIDIHTDDPEYAKELFPEIVPIKDIALNWRALRYAKHAIISNSAFAILPRLLNGGETGAPKFWAGRNVGEWRRPCNYYKQFTYI